MGPKMEMEEDDTKEQSKEEVVDTNGTTQQQDDSSSMSSTRSSKAIIKSTLANTVLPLTTFSFIFLLLAILTCNFINDEISGHLSNYDSSIMVLPNNSTLYDLKKLRKIRLAKALNSAGQQKVTVDESLEQVNVMRYFGLFTAEDVDSHGKCLLFDDFILHKFPRNDFYAEFSRICALIAFTVITLLMCWLVFELIAEYCRKSQRILTVFKHNLMVAAYLFCSITSFGIFMIIFSESIGCGDKVLATSRCRPGVGVLLTFISFLCTVGATLLLLRIRKFLLMVENSPEGSSDERLKGGDIEKQESSFLSAIVSDVEILRLENIAIPASYLTVGLLMGFTGPFLNVYPLDHGATPVEQAAILQLRGLPATFKILLGFLSDNVKFFGFRRKSYMVLGWTIAGLSMLTLLIHMLSGKKVPIPFLAFLGFTNSLGFWWADTMADTLVAERAKLEPESKRGQLQSTCYASRFFGTMVAAPLSSVLYSTVGPQYIVLILTTLPLLMLPLIYFLLEKNVNIKSTPEQCKEIWNAVSSRAVWQPLSFVFIYAFLQIGNAAWKQYLRTVLHFSSFQLNTFIVASSVMLYSGIMVYKFFLMGVNWRVIFIGTTVVGAVLSVLQIMLILGNTFGLPKYLFALGDDIFGDFVNGIQFLPVTIMMVGMTPDGSEGASYAMFTTVNNSAMMLSGSVGNQLLKIWDVSKTALSEMKLDGFLKLTILTSCLQFSGIFFISLLPRNHRDINELKKRKSSRIGGAALLSITFLSIFYSTTIFILSITDPKSIEGRK